MGNTSNLALRIKQVLLFGLIFGLVFSIGALNYETVFAQTTPGTQGDNQKVFTGDGPPPDELAKIGELYFDSSNDGYLDYYVKVDKTVWEFRGTLVQPDNSCTKGQILKYDDVSKKWECTDELDTLASLSCFDGEVAKWDSTQNQWMCANDHDILESLDCAVSQVAKYEGHFFGWECGDDDDTLGDLMCSDDQVAVWNSTSTKWECGNSSDTLSSLSCSSGGLAKWNGIEWICGVDLVDDADANPTNELQTLAQLGTEIFLSQNGGKVSVNDTDANPSNELQTLSQIGTDVTLSQSGGAITVNDPDSDPRNELQNLVVATKMSSVYVVTNGIPVSGAVDCDSSFFAIGANIIPISTYGGVIEFRSLSFNGPTASFTLEEIATLEDTDIMVMITCLKLDPLTP